MLLIPHVTPFGSSSIAGQVLRRAQAFAWCVRVCFAASVGLIAVGLWHWGALEVRAHFDQVLALTLLGVGWLVISMHLFAWFGLSIADDAIERRNSGALLALCGATFGVAVIYAGGSFGEGPSYWNNIFSGALGTFGFFLLWCLLEFFVSVSGAVAEERDLASGLRLSGVLLSLGLILGRAVAGDWHSVSATVHDFMRDGWPAAALCFVAAFTEWLAQPNRNRPSPSWLSYGLLPALAYIAAAVAWLYHIGRWEGMPS